MNFLSLPKSSLILKSRDYRKIYRYGKRLKGDNVSLIYIVSKKQSRLGISIHGVKSAVRRNRIKRVIREFYRHNQQFMSSPADMVFTIRAGFAADSPQEVEEVVKKLLLSR